MSITRRRVVPATIVLFLGICIVLGYSLLRLTVPNLYSVYGTWRTSYYVFASNLVLGDLSDISAVSGRISCHEDLKLFNTGGYSQRVECPNAEIDVTRSGEWRLMTDQTCNCIRLEGFLFLVPNVDLQVLARTDPSFSMHSIGIVPPEIGLRQWNITSEKGYVYPNDGYVLLYARLETLGRGLILIHGTVIDEPAVIYHRESESVGL